MAATAAVMTSDGQIDPAAGRPGGVVTSAPPVRGGATAPGDRSRDRYLSLVAHELRSPLTMIQGWLDVLREGGCSDEEQAQALAAVDIQVARLRRLADDALDATRVSVGQLELAKVDVELGRSVEEAVRARPGTPVEVSVDDGDLTVQVDPLRFGQILHNLLDNARTHGVGQPSVRVHRRGPVGEVVITSPGPPIDPDLAALLFEPFERGSAMGQGVGLGLYVCRSLTEAHGGCIGLRVTDAGNEFWLQLPLRSPPAGLRETGS